MRVDCYYVETTNKSGQKVRGTFIMPETAIEMYSKRCEQMMTEGCYSLVETGTTNDGVNSPMFSLDVKELETVWG